MDLGTIIKETRKEKQYTQKAFAELCTISQTYLSQIESNRKEPNLSTLKVIAKNLGLPLPILFFKSLTSDDIPNGKKDAFETISPFFNNLIKSILPDD